MSAEKANAALRLMLIDDSAEDAEAIVSGLRNAGIAVRPLRPQSVEELQGMLEAQIIDLVLAAQQSDGISLGHVLRLVQASGKDLPVVAVADKVDETTLSEALAAGVRAIALRHKPQQLLGAVRTEWADLEARRSLRLLEAQVRETERRCDALIESSREPIAYVHEGMHIRANSAYLEMFGYQSFEEIEGMSLLDMIASQYVEDFKKLLKTLSKGEPPPPRYELEARDMEGNAFPAVMEFTQALYEGEPCVQILFRRQEVDPELAREVEKLRQRDQTTGLLNRPTFLHALEDAVADAAQSKGQHALLLVEPDHYQTLVHEIGLDSADALLAALAQRLRDALGDALTNGTAQPARFGEHNLAVLLHANHLETVALAERIREAFASQVFEIGQNSASITASIGGVQIGEKIASVTQVLAKANQGVQTCMGVGGNRCEIFDPGAVDRAEVERVDAWVERLRDALQNDHFCLHFQPVVSLKGEPGAMYEVYIRLDAGSGELIAPGNFMQIAGEHGLLIEIDRWVLGHAIALIAQRREAGKPVTLLVKLSQGSMTDESLADFIGEQLFVHQIPGEHLVLQLAEAKVFTHLRAAQAFATAVAKHGCRVGLEQFGVGLDSFQLLTHFSPAFLKIDRSFCEDLPKNEANQLRVAEIADKVRERGLHSIAEFVQDAASLAVLFSSGIDYVEGNFLAPAGPEMDYDFD